ncbi:peptidase M23 [Micromonospora narathiwatensis]|uniref:LasA protease n=1 Tax=Micromonospora narathiwatensis TaxID=299146 RepID=A0A1A8ZPY7_9ACTN|nr:peptidase M23 [Micromonospora narathiwatensis]SBT45892.1 LasA protease [Micromonospora narathiwatensis]
MFRTQTRGRVGVAALASAIVLAAPAAAGAAPGAAAAPSTGGVNSAVTARLLDQAANAADAGLRSAGTHDTRVTVTRRDGQTWAFGTAVIVAPHEEDAYPAGWVFVARRERAGWRVALDGEAGFADLAQAAPASVVSPRERALFTEVAPTYAGGDYRTGMRLPYGLGQSWSFTGGPHGWAGSDTPWSSIDLAGGDQRVLAARGGTAYTMCRGWIRVIHDRGYATDYYHLWNNISVNGASVGEGAYLGDTGTDVTCGGAASGRHVHFALRQNNAYVPVAGHNLGKWVVMGGGGTYQGYALHGSAQVNVGGALYNHGALGLNQALIDANGGGTVNRRTGPGTGYAVAGSAADGATVTVSCSANGTTHAGRWGSTALWNRLSDGTWASDAFMWTGSAGPINGWC